MREPGDKASAKALGNEYLHPTSTMMPVMFNSNELAIKL
jgi:hypothetical protein